MDFQVIAPSLNVDFAAAMIKDLLFVFRNTTACNGLLLIGIVHIHRLHSLVTMI